MSVRPRSGKSRGAVSWLGLSAIAGGLTLIWLYVDTPRLAKSPNPINAIVYLGTGCVLVLWGLRATIGDVGALFGRLRHRPAQRYRVRMPPEAFVYMLILGVLCLGALLGHSNMLMLVFGLMAGPFVLNGQMTLAILKRVSVRRRLPEQAIAGEKFPVTLTLSNRKRFFSSWMVVAEDVVESRTEQLLPAVLFACVPAKSEREAAYDLRLARRGLYEFGPVRIMSRFPLGLMERSFELGSVEELVVYPRIGRLKPRWRQPADSGDPVSDFAQSKVGACDDEFHRLREYRAGDNPRAIHWRTTARRNELMVQEYQQNRRRDLLLIVDLWLPARPRPDDLERVELAVSFAASICVDQLQTATDSGLQLVIVGKETSTTNGAGASRAFEDLLEQLALAEAGPASGLRDAVHEAAHAGRTQLRKVLITSRTLERVRGVMYDGPAAAGDAAELEVIEAAPQNLAEYLEFDDCGSASGRTR